jgi:signal transduction histidine kinase
MDRLRELDALKNEFVAIVAHDLRSPMSVIAGFAQMLQLHGPNISEAERPSILERIVVNIGRLSDLVGAVLDVARLESGDFAYQAAAFDLAEVLRRTLDEAETTQPHRWRTERADWEGMR